MRGQKRISVSKMEFAFWMAPLDIGLLCQIGIRQTGKDSVELPWRREGPTFGTQTELHNQCNMSLDGGPGAPWPLMEALPSFLTH